MGTMLTSPLELQGLNDIKHAKHMYQVHSRHLINISCGHKGEEEDDDAAAAADTDNDDDNNDSADVVTMVLVLAVTETLGTRHQVDHTTALGPHGLLVLCLSWLDSHKLFDACRIQCPFAWAVTAKSTGSGFKSKHRSPPSSGAG